MNDYTALGIAVLAFCAFVGALPIVIDLFRGARAPHCYVTSHHSTAATPKDNA